MHPTRQSLTERNGIPERGTARPRSEICPSAEYGRVALYSFSFLRGCGCTPHSGSGRRCIAPKIFVFRSG